jgi:hypothetical protein
MAERGIDLFVDRLGSEKFGKNIENIELGTRRATFPSKD